MKSSVDIDDVCTARDELFICALVMTFIICSVVWSSDDRVVTALCFFGFSFPFLPQFPL